MSKSGFIRLFCVTFLIIFGFMSVVDADYNKMSVDLCNDGVFGSNYVGIPGILYDQNNETIDTVSDLAVYLDYLGIMVAGDNIQWLNPCTQSTESYSKTPVPSLWFGDNFEIYPGQGIVITVSSDCSLKLNIEYIDNNHTICENKYCEIVIDSSDEEIIIETVYISPSHEDVALLFYLFIIPILYLFVAFKKGISMVNLSAIFLIFAFFLILFQTIEISVNYIYIIIFLFLFVLSIAGITLEKRS